MNHLLAIGLRLIICDEMNLSIVYDLTLKIGEDCMWRCKKYFSSDINNMIDLIQTVNKALNTEWATCPT